jgi:hypothetical protein
VEHPANSLRTYNQETRSVLDGIMTKAKKLKCMQNVGLGFFGISVAGALLANAAWLKDYGAIIGGASLYGVAKEYFSQKSLEYSQKKNDYYIPFLLSQRKK